MTGTNTRKKILIVSYRVVDSCCKYYDKKAQEAFLPAHSERNRKQSTALLVLTYFSLYCISGFHFTDLPFSLITWSMKKRQIYGCGFKYHFWGTRNFSKLDWDFNKISGVGFQLLISVQLLSHVLHSEA